MIPKMINNKWNEGKRNFIFPLSSIGDFTKDGTWYYPMILNKKVGREVCIVIYDETDFINELAAIKPFKFSSLLGLAKTSYGTVLYNLFSVADPKNKHTPFYLGERPTDPQDPKQYSLLFELTNQKYIHVILLGLGNIVHGFYEFKNTFYKKKDLQMLLSAVKRYELGYFDYALEEYFRKYNPIDLYNTGHLNLYKSKRKKLT